MIMKQTLIPAPKSLMFFDLDNVNLMEMKNVTNGFRCYESQKLIHHNYNNPKLMINQHMMFFNLEDILRPRVAKPKDDKVSMEGVQRMFFYRRHP